MGKDYLRASIKTNKPIVYIDMDGVLANFDKRHMELLSEGYLKHQAFKHKRAFEDLDPMPGAIDAWNYLQSDYETYILSTPAWSNERCWTDKRIWVEKYLGKTSFKKLILCHNKGLLTGDYLIDDRIANGVADFKGVHVHFGQEGTKDWQEVIKYIDKLRLNV